MSTKIYDGYKINTGNIYTINKLLEDTRLAYVSAAKTYLTELYAGLVQTAWDSKITRQQSFQADPELKNKSLCFYAITHFWDKQNEIKATQHRNPYYDIEFDISLFLDGTDRTLAIIYCENNSLSEYFRTHNLVEYYGYWNNTDPPDDMSDEAWDIRGKEWDSKMPTGYPVDSCYSRKFLLHDTIIDSKDILNAIKPIEVRAKKEAYELLIQEYYDKNKNKDTEYNMSLFRAADVWAREENRLKEKTAEIIPMLSMPTLDDITK